MQNPRDTASRNLNTQHHAVLKKHRVASSKCRDRQHVFSSVTLLGNAAISLLAFPKGACSHAATQGQMHGIPSMTWCCWLLDAFGVPGLNTTAELHHFTVLGGTTTTVGCATRIQTSQYSRCGQGFFEHHDVCCSHEHTLEKVAPWSVISGSFAVCISPLNLDTAGNNV